MRVNPVRMDSQGSPLPMYKAINRRAKAASTAHTALWVLPEPMAKVAHEECEGQRDRTEWWVVIHRLVHQARWARPVVPDVMVIRDLPVKRVKMASALLEGPDPKASQDQPDLLGELATMEKMVELELQGQRVDQATPAFKAPPVATDNRDQQDPPDHLARTRSTAHARLVPSTRVARLITTMQLIMWRLNKIGWYNHGTVVFRAQPFNLLSALPILVLCKRKAIFQ